MLESGWLYVLPFATGAVLTAIGGWVCDTLCRRLGGLRGCRITAMSGLVLVAIFLFAGVFAPNPYVAVGLLSLCFGFTLFTDTRYWAATTYAAGEHTASACGMLNFGGNMRGPARAARRVHDRSRRLGADHRERLRVRARGRRLSGCSCA